MQKRQISIAKDWGRFDGLLMSLGEEDDRPIVLIFPSFVGRSDADLEVGERLLAAGYRSLACDVYGEGRRGSTREECTALMQPLMDDRAELKRRLLVWLEEATGLAGGDAGAVAAIGFCFGGLCALDLARTGAAIAGVASFHGLFAPSPASAGLPINTKVVAFHGWDDPMVPPGDVTALADELTAAGADWQIHAYGGTMHGFTNPKAAAPELGVQYHEPAARRAWSSLFNFLEEIFG